MTRPRCAPDDAAYHQFAAGFQFEPTADQLTCFEAIRRDMVESGPNPNPDPDPDPNPIPDPDPNPNPDPDPDPNPNPNPNPDPSQVESDRPMDRLICGDVGFGKTEVGMRAIYRAVANGRQVFP